MNYDIHVGAILSLPGRIAAFLAALIVASLPITGFYIWWGKRKKKTAASLAVAERVGITVTNSNRKLQTQISGC